MPKTKKLHKNNAVIFQTKNGALELRGDFGRETLWASQAQIVDLYGVDQSVVSRHVKNIFKDGEIDEKSNMQKMHIPLKVNHIVKLFSIISLKIAFL